MAEKEHYVREISSFLSRTAGEVENVLSRLKWKKENLLKKVNSSKLVHCPNDFSHRIPASRLDKHLSVCQYKAKGIKPQDVCTSPEFFYQKCSAVIPIFIDEGQYSSFKNGRESGQLDTGPHTRVHKKAVPTCCTMVKSKEGISPTNTQNMIINGKAAQSDSTDEIRSIMAWEVIPSSHTQLDLHLLSQEKIKTWIIGNLPQVQYLSSLEGASDRLVNFVISCLQEEKVAHPRGMEEMLKDLLGDETQAFVWNLWKFLAVSITKERNDSIQSRVENRTQESSVKSSKNTTDSLEPVPVESSVKEITLPMDRVITELSPQQRLAVYEHVMQASKEKREIGKQEMDFEVVSDPNDPKGTEGDQPKSHFEALAEQRDYKRRRQSYRAKNVHITKRSAVEVMRDLIETQMHVLEMQYKEEHGITSNNSDEGDVSEEKRDNRGQKDNTRRESRDEEETRRMERDRRQHREGNKRVRYHDDRDSDSKRSRR